MGSNEFIRVKVEGISQLEKMQAFLDPKLFQKATRLGILAAATSANKQAGKSISQRYNIGSRRIKQDVSLFNSCSSSDSADLIFVVITVPFLRLLFLNKIIKCTIGLIISFRIFTKIIICNC